VHKCMRPTGAKGRPNRAGMGLGQSAQAGQSCPVLGSVWGPPPGGGGGGGGGAAIRRRESHSHREAFHKLDREGRSSEEDRSSRRKHPQVEKREDTVGSITMINGAMSSTLMW
jgi:hypothetical protein